MGSAKLQLCLLFLLVTSTLQWQNDLDGALNVQCSDKQGFYRVISNYSNYHRDRRWQWDCHTVAEIAFGDDCYWTGWLNLHDMPLYTQCAPNYVLAGVNSIHDSVPEDRLWSMKCCKAKDHFTRGCKVSSYLNSYKRYLNFTINSPRVFTGLFSAHENSVEDRIWAVQTCEYFQCKGSLTCEHINDTCEHFITPNGRGEYKCSCYNGYKLASNEKSCIDIDECSTDNSGCSDNCINTPGSFQCFCDDGYSLEENGLICSAISSSGLSSSASAGVSLAITVPVTTVITALLTVLVMYLCSIHKPKELKPHTSCELGDSPVYSVSKTTGLEMGGNASYGQVIYTTIGTNTN